jgi:hypothetical protein
MTTITIHNVATGEITEREMNAEELAQFQADQTAETLRQQAEELKAAEKIALLSKLGISENEAKLLLS